MAEDRRKEGERVRRSEAGKVGNKGLTHNRCLIRVIRLIG